MVSTSFLFIELFFFIPKIEKIRMLRENKVDDFIKNAENIMKDRNQKLVEDMSKEELKVLFPDLSKNLF